MSNRDIAIEFGALVVLWLIPLIVGGWIGDKRGRRGWLYAFFLSWLGVLIVLALRPMPGSPADTKRQGHAQVDPASMRLGSAIAVVAICLASALYFSSPSAASPSRP